jgi:hypothetical protein
MMIPDRCCISSANGQLISRLCNLRLRRLSDRSVKIVAPGIGLRVLGDVGAESTFITVVTAGPNQGQ